MTQTPRCKTKAGYAFSRVVFLVSRFIKTAANLKWPAFTQLTIITARNPFCRLYTIFFQTPSIVRPLSHSLNAPSAFWADSALQLPLWTRRRRRHNAAWHIGCPRVQHVFIYTVSSARMSPLFTSRVCCEAAPPTQRSQMVTHWKENSPASRAVSWEWERRSGGVISFHSSPPGESAVSPLWLCVI